MRTDAGVSPEGENMASEGDGGRVCVYVCAGELGGEGGGGDPFL